RHPQPLDPVDAAHEDGQQRQRQVAVRDRPAERALLGALDVHVDPLVVAGGVGEQVHPVLGDLQPVAAAERPADLLGELVQAPEDPHHMCLPPATSMVIPVTNDDRSEARNSAALATSSGSPMRPSGMLSTICFSASGGMAAVIAVRIGPGWMALTRIRNRASSLADALVRPISPALAEL